jgi:hypothetical protein
MSGYDLKDYIDVRQRLELFYIKHPEGSIQFEFMGVLDANPEYFYGIAYAYRTPNDERPGKGYAQELINGKTSFTRGSELMNLETSAVGRAIGMLGIGISQGVATMDEVVAAQARQDTRPAPTKKPLPKGTEATGNATKAQADLILKLVDGKLERIQEWKDKQGIGGTLTKWQASLFIEELKAEAPLFTEKRKDYDPWAVEQNQ